MSRPVLIALALLPVGLRYARFGSFEGLGHMSVAHHSEAAPSPGGFSRPRVSDGKGENDDEELGGADGASMQLATHTW